MRIFISLFFLCLFSNGLFAEEPAKDLYWDKDKEMVSYTISKDCLVKIRVGSEKGPVYRTLVNVEKRKAGAYQEFWNVEDESGLINFKDYEPLHFCIDTLPKPEKDLLLQVSLPKEIPMRKGIIKLRQSSSMDIKVDVNEKDKKEFCREGIEAMAFIDNKLIKIDRAKTLPHSLNLDLKDSVKGKHLLTLNVWSGDHTSLAYKNLIILSEAKKEILPKKKIGKSKAVTGKIAYCQRQKGFWQVWAANLDGSKSRQLTKSAVDKRYPSFSPDAKRIAYVTNEGKLWIIDENGRNNKRIPLPLHVSQPRWSPDGKRIDFVSYQDLYHGDSEIWEVDLKTLKLKKLTNRPWLQYDPCYSPDGSNLLFTDGPELYAQEIRKLDLKTNDIIQLTDNDAYDYDMQPAYLSTGETIAYTSNESGNYDIWVMDKFGRYKKNLSRNSAYDIMPWIDVDGRWIYFLSDRTGTVEVWRMDSEGANLRQITKDKKDKQDLNVYTALTEK